MTLKVLVVMFEKSSGGEVLAAAVQASEGQVGAEPVRRSVQVGSHVRFSLEGVQHCGVVVSVGSDEPSLGQTALVDFGGQEIRVDVRTLKVVDSDDAG